ncbi:MAG: hypothetical protein ACPHEP_00015 [Acidimicrobiales bacterium]
MTISNQDARTGPYSGNGATTSFAYDFKVIDEDHLVVTLKNSSNVETVQTITTNYTVTGVGANGGGTVEMVVAPASGETLTISRAVPLTQEVDLANRGGVQPEVLETAYDKLTQSVQDQAELFGRIPRFPVSSSLTDIELPLTLTANAVLAVNSAGTAFTNGPTSAQISSAQSYATAAEAALDEFTDLYLGAKASDPTLDNDGNALQDGALYFDTTLNVMKVYDLGTTTWKRTTPTTGEQANIDTVVADAVDIGTVAGISANVTTVAGNSSNVTTVAGISSDVTTVAADGTDIGTVAGISSDVTTVAGISSDVTTVAADGTDIGTVAGISSNVTTVAGISSDVTTVAGISGDVSSVAAQVVGYNFSTTTAMADPGSGNLRFNNATVASVTAIAIDDLDSNGVDQSAYIALWDDSTNTVKGTLVFRTGGGDVATFNITGLTDNTGWFQIAVTHVASSGTFSNTEDTFIGFTRTGDKGADGAGSGDVSGPGASVTDNAAVRWDGTTGQLVQNSTVTIDDAGAIAAGSLTLTTDLAVADGGTGASTASAARSNISAAASGANSDITSISGLTTALSTGQGGTGLTALGTAGQVLKVNSGATALEYAADNGKVLQVVQGTTSTAQSTTSTSFTDANLNVAITPSATTSKFLVHATIHTAGQRTDASTYTAIIRFKETGVTNDTFPSGTHGYGYGWDASSSSYDHYTGDVQHFHWYHAPTLSDTSALTYTLQFRALAGTAWSHYNSNATSVITVMEIGA